MQRHPRVAERFVRDLEGPSDPQHLQRAARATVQLANVEGFEVPSWSYLAAGAQPPLRNIEDLEPGHSSWWVAARGSGSGGVAVSGHRT